MLVVAEAEQVLKPERQSIRIVELFSFIKGNQHPGVIFRGGIVLCPTYFGRYNNLGNAVDMFRTLKENPAFERL